MKSDAITKVLYCRLFFDAIFSAFWAGVSHGATSSYAQNKHTVRVVVVQVPWINAILVYGVAVVSSFDFVGIRQVCFPDNRFDSTSCLGF
jgi:hypothetical protein